MNPRRRRFARHRRSRARWLRRYNEHEATLSPRWRSALPRRPDGRIDWAAIQDYYLQKTGTCSFPMAR